MFYKQHNWSLARKSQSMVWALGVCLMLLAGCSREDPQPKADMVFFNATIPALFGNGGSQGLAVRDDKIVVVEPGQSLEELIGPSTRRFDLEGKSLLPGFVDHHVHLLNMGLSLLNESTDGSLFLDLSGMTPSQIQHQLAERAGNTPPGEWILGKGWSQEVWGQVELPTHTLLTEAAPANPVYLSRVDGHAGWVNLEALETSGLTSQTPDPPGGIIQRYESGQPSGTLLERANEPVLQEVPYPSSADLTRAFRMACRAMAAQGVTEVYDAGFLQMPGVVALNFDFAGALVKITESDLEDPLPLEINLMIPAPSELAEQILSQPQAYRSLTPRLRVTHIKLFADGAMGSRGAALSHPFHDDPSTRGIHRMTEEEQRNLTIRALDAGLDVATHCIGDAALSRTLGVYENLLQERSDLAPERLRIEHFSYATDNDFQRAADLGVVLSIQPNFVVPDNSGLTMEDRRVGPSNSQRAYAWKRLHMLGATLAGGSDYFTKPEVPLLNFYAAATRKNPGGRPGQGWHPEERLDRETALLLFTRFFSSGGRPTREPLIRTGQQANLTILSADPLKAQEGDILNIRVLATVSKGRMTFSNGIQEEIN